MSKAIAIDQFRQWGSEGGRISKRKLSKTEARRMARKSAEVRRPKTARRRAGTSTSVHGTQEWAAHNINIQVGCEHDCKYCYAKCMGARFKRTTASSWATPKLLEEKVHTRPRKYAGKVMFPTTHDITPYNITECTAVLAGLCGAGNEILIVTKPHLDCIRTLCIALSAYQDRIMFRLTIGSTDDNVLTFWEPNAPLFRERINALKHASECGFRTSVSCEPMLDTNVAAVIKAVRSYVTDTIWLGRVNQLGAGVAINCPRDETSKQAARQLLSEQSDSWVLSLYGQWKNDPMIRWKDSIKKVVGITRPTTKGLDI